MGIRLTQRKINGLLHDLRYERHIWQRRRINVDNNIFGFWIKFTMNIQGVNFPFRGRVIAYDAYDVENSSLFMAYLDDEVKKSSFYFISFF